jgi:hypothetical protein
MRRSGRGMRGEAAVGKRRGVRGSGARSVGSVRTRRCPDSALNRAGD